MPQPRAPRPVGVIGPGADDATEQQVREAELIGLGLARAGVPVICGGLYGVMDGVARGVRAGGGDITGVVPGTDVSVANEHLTHVIAACGAGEMRNQIIVASSAALVVVGMNPGTAIEVLMAMSRKLDKPAFGVNVEGLCSGPLRLDSMTLFHDEDDDGGEPAWSRAVRAAAAVALSAGVRRDEPPLSRPALRSDLGR